MVRIGLILLIVFAVLLFPNRLVNRTPPPLTEVRRVPRVTVQIALGAPLATLPRLKLSLAVHNIYLLKGKRLSLVEEEVHDDRGRSIGAEENEAETVADARVGEGGQERDHEVAEPVACCGKGSLLCASAEREGLPNNDPGEGTPDVALLECDSHWRREA